MQLSRGNLGLDSGRFKYLRGLFLLLCAWCVAGATQARAATMYAIRGTPGTELVRFESSTPSTLSSLGNISGLQASEEIVGMDFSPYLGAVYAVGSTSRVYKIDLASARATAVSATPFAPALQKPFNLDLDGFECDRSAPEARVINNFSNYRISLVTGQVLGTGTGPGQNIFAIAQANSGSAATYYGISFGTQSNLVRFDNINTGAATTIGSVGLALNNGFMGMDIAADGVAYASLQDTNSSNNRLFWINLTTGAATSQGLIGDGTQVISSLTSAQVLGSGTITISDNAPAAPYPSQITVSGSSNVPISKVRVRLNGLTHGFADDVRVLLVGPQGQSSVLMANAGGGGVSNADVTFDDDATQSLRDNSPPSIASGTYKPTSYANGLTQNFPAPAPAAPYTASLGVFKGTTPNGVWSLYVYDDDAGIFGTITNGWSLFIDQAPSFYDLSSPGYTVSEAAGSATVTINRTGNTATADRVSLISAQGSATSGVDYTPLMQNPSIAFAPGESSKTVTIPILNDSLAEGDESFVVILRPANDTVFDSVIGSTLPSARVTIVDDDALPVISVANASVSEGAPGAFPAATFNATLDKPANVPVSFKYLAADTTGDFVSASGTATFAAGATTTSFTVSAIGDAFAEPDESFAVTLSDAANGTLASGTATLTITNDDAAAPVLTVANQQVAEGAAGTTTQVVFTAVLSAPSALPVSFKYLAGQGLPPTAALPGEDFLPASGTVTFAPGTTSTTFSVTVLGDSKPEPNEEARITLSDVTNAQLAEVPGQPGLFFNAVRLIITNDDAGVTISSLAPASGKVGTVVAINGTGLAGGKVFFNGVAANVASASATKIVATVPKGATTGKIRVEAASGTAQSAANFKVAPTISAALSLGGYVNATFYIAGDSLSDVTGVKIGTATASFTRLTNTLLRVVVPQNAVTGAISVTSPGGTTTTATKFTILPAIVSFSPGSGVAGSRVVIRGSGFSSVSSVVFGSGAAAATAAFVVNSPNQITATVPANAPTGIISVVTPPGRAISRTNFTILPSARSFTPAKGSAGTEVTINGSGFVGVRGVSFNGAAATFRVVSPTQIVAIAPRNVATGKLKVTTASGESTTAGVFTVVSVPAG